MTADETIIMFALSEIALVCGESLTEKGMNVLYDTYYAADGTTKDYIADNYQQTRQVIETCIRRD